jgi:hypothetical protein
MRQEEMHFKKKAHQLDVAVDQLAKVVAVTVHAYTANLPGVFASLAGDLSGLTLSLGFEQQDSGEEKVKRRRRRQKEEQEEEENIKETHVSSFFLELNLTPPSSARRWLNSTLQLAGSCSCS